MEVDMEVFKIVAGLIVLIGFIAIPAWAICRNVRKQGEFEASGRGSKPGHVR